ncbi:PAS domain-containing sensor histidine kinase [Paenibacillus periandrae]|uniref:PAS domain-containing sensor histidine kinase n=1 Tax=Paenibacillus periandrae TaxID=1761741 RepID=UPI001F089A3D|nr:PAS domain-containing sensor histidine kinase [Paenibacillus periandrae]
MINDYRFADEIFIQAFQHAPIGMALVATNGAVLKANASACSMLGYSEDELTRIAFQEIAHPDDVVLNHELMSQLIEGKRESYQMEKRFFHKQGSITWLQLTVSLVRDEGGKPLFFISQLINISTFKLAEEGLREKEHQLLYSEQRYRSLFEHHPDLIFSMDLEGTFTSINHSVERLIGYTDQQIQHNAVNYRTFMHPKDNKKVEYHFALAAKGLTQRYETEALDKNGNCISFDVTHIPIIVNHQVMGVYGIAKNITKQKELWLQLKESQELYQIISDNAQEIISYSTPDGITRYVSPAIKTILGYEPEEVIGTVTTDYWHPEDRAFLIYNGLFPISEVDIFTCRARHKNGHYIWIETTLKLIRNRKGKISKLFSVGRDISERKQAEDELRKTKDRLESLIQNNADAIWVIDLEDQVIEANAAFESMFQWSLEEIVCADLVLLIVPDHLKDSVRMNLNQVKSGHSVIGFETVRLRKDGNLIEVSGTLSPVRDEQGLIVGIMGMYRDISERKRVVQELNAAKDQLESFIDHNVDPIVIVNLEEKVSRVNHAFEKVFGWSAAEIIGLSILKLPIMLPDLSPQMDMRQKVFKSDEPLTGYETVRRRKDGTVIPVMLSSFGMRDEQDHIHGWAVILRDITAQKQAEELVINSKKLSIAGQLAAGIAHEIRNPITAIKGFVQFMQSGSLQKQIYFDIISSEIERIEMILSELLILAKPQSVQYERKDIRILIGQVTTLLGTQAIMNNVQIDTEFELETTYILCDENQLKQVCINFIKNAIEAMPKGGTIVIQLKSKDRKNLLLRFIDHGFGIPEHILSRLGEPFYTTKEKGTGLGFMVSKKIIENHQGSIEVFSKEHEGTTVEVTLPIAH